jgi:hypothetical protein
LSDGGEELREEEGGGGKKRKEEGRGHGWGEINTSNSPVTLQ